MYLHSDRNECNYEGKWELEVIERYEKSDLQGQPGKQEARRHHDRE